MFNPVLRGQGAAFPPGAVDWLRMRYKAVCARFAVLQGDRAFFHGDQPGIGDRAIWGYAQWLPRAGVQATPVMQGWLDRMRLHPAMRAPKAMFPASD